MLRTRYEVPSSDTCQAYACTPMSLYQRTYFQDMPAFIRMATWSTPIYSCIRRVLDTITLMGTVAPRKMRAVPTKRLSILRSVDPSGQRYVLNMRLPCIGIDVHGGHVLFMISNEGVFDRFTGGVVPVSPPPPDADATAPLPTARSNTEARAHIFTTKIAMVVLVPANPKRNIRFSPPSASCYRNAWRLGCTGT